MAQSEYEFTTEQNQIISRVATKIQHVSYLLFVITAVLFVQSIAGLAGTMEVHQLAATIAGTVAAAALGYLFLRGSNHLKAIVLTEGGDITALFRSFNLFRNFYLLLWILIGLGIASRVLEAVG